MQRSVCSGCAGQVGGSWSYCKTCGVRRVPGHVTPNPPPQFLDLDQLSSAYSCANLRTLSMERRGRLSMQRALSEVGRRQLQQWRTKSILQERLLIDLERSNATARQAAAIKAKRELRGTIHQDHGLVARKWSSSSMLARGLDTLQPLRSKNAIALPGEGRPSFRNNPRAEPKAIVKIAATRENILKTQQQETQARRKVATSAPKSKAWFWGAGNGTRNNGGDTTPASPRTPGQGAMGIFWGSTPQAAVDAPAAASSSVDSSTKALGLLQQDGQLKKSALLGSRNTGTPISLLSAKAAVRSASNRAAELARLAGEEYRAVPRDECVAKAKSAVRAARSAVSCTNERLFELELMVETNPAEGAEHERGQGAKSGEARHGDHEASIASPVSSQITQLAVQLQLSQCLLATSIAAEARMMARFAREEAAATFLQAHLRGLFARSRSHRWKQLTKGKTTVADWSQDTSIIASISSHERPRAPLKNTAPAKVGDCEKAQPPDAEPPRQEGGWWVPAERESADDVGKTEMELLKTVVKLQAIVRSRIARLRTIASVNERFVQYFDDEYQHPFYVCKETNNSQWNRPFGFDGSLDHSSVLATASKGGVDGGNRATERVKVEADRGLRELDEQNGAAVIIQCAVRVALARCLFAEKVVHARYFTCKKMQ